MTQSKENRKNLSKNYKDSTVMAGIYLIKNLINGKILLGSAVQIHGPLNRHKLELSTGSHKNKSLLADYKEYGENNFSFEILETLEHRADPAFDLDQELQLLEEIWMEKLHVEFQQGYNSNRLLKKTFLG